MIRDPIGSTDGSGLKGRIGLHPVPGVDGVGELRRFAPLASPRIYESRDELLEMVASGQVDFGFLVVTDGASAIDTYEAISRHRLSVVSEHLAESDGCRFFLLAQGSWDSLRFQPGQAVGPLWLDFPVLSAGRTSVLFAIPDRPGALVRALGAISRRHLNVSKLEMRQASGLQGECTIVADIEGYAHSQPLREALGELNRLARDVRVLGAYPASAT